MSVLIAGAGPTGLTLACGLRQFGVDVRLVDAADGPATTSRALGVQPRSTGVLRRLGALGDLLDRAILMRHMVIHLGLRVFVNVGLVEVFGRAGYVPPVLVSQAVVEATLRRRFADLGGSIEWHTGVAGGVASSDGVVVELSTGERCHTDWLIGCDGAHSRVRKVAGVEFRGSAVAERFVLADLHLDIAGSRDAARTWLHPDGVLVVFPLPSANDDLWRVIVETTLSDDVELTDRELEELAVRGLQERAGMTDVHVTGIEWLSNFRISQRLANTYRSGRVLLAGDAAHIHSPFGGQGMNTGIGDAENLAWKLALVVNGRADQALLDTYEAERRPVARSVIVATGAATRIGLSRNPIITALRAYVAAPFAPTVARLPFVQKRIAVAVSQMGVSYRSGPLGGGRFRRGLVAGDPVPDIAVVGHKETLYGIIGPVWAVVASTVDEADQLAITARKFLGDDSVVALASSDSRVSGVLLVRPDGHLAWRDSKKSAPLDSWIENAALRAG